LANINTEISRLTNKDVKIRRRAVRTLFDADNPDALSGFVKLLDDSDFWFRNKSLDAHRKWARTAEDLEPLMANNKRLVAELLQRISAPDLAEQLLEEEDHIIRGFAARSLSKSENLHKKFASDVHHSVRIVAAENSTDSELISKLVEDPHSAVKRAAISTASINKMKLSDETMKLGLDSPDPNLRSLIGTLAVDFGGEILLLACNDDSPRVRRAIAETLRSDVEIVDARIIAISESCPEIVVRWLRSKYDKKSSDLRWKMIENADLNSRTRSKLIEQMHGRSDVDTERLSNLFGDASELVVMSAKNLVKSIKELEGEI